MNSVSTLFRYVSRQFLAQFGVIMFVLLGIIFLFDVVETLRRAAGHASIPVGVVISMSLMKLPFLAQSALPMGILFTAIYTCWKLNKTSELVVMRSCGLSAWQFLSPLLICALAIGIFSTTALNPVSALFINKRNQMSSVYFPNERDLVTVSKTGIWLRQPSEEGYALIHSATFDKGQWKLHDVIVLFFDKADNFVRRMDTPSAHLEEGNWVFDTPTINDKRGMQRLDIEKIPTALTATKMEESFADPETISFWSIPEYITIMEDTGFPATRLYIHFHALLAQPFLLAAMVLIAATFALRPQRAGGVARLIAVGLATGFLVFFFQSVLQAFGLSQKIPAYLAAWAPAAITLLLGTTALLHLEDG